MSDPVVVTGAAGFIGHAVSARLLDRGETVIGVDNLNEYYDPGLKLARLSTLLTRQGFQFERLDVANAEAFGALVLKSGAKRLVHLAAQAGVRYSLDHPFEYEHSNIAAHLSVLEACRAVSGFRHLTYSSSSSVYGDRTMTTRGFHEDDPCNRPVSLYAATKRSCELMSSSYAALFGFPQTGLRFFTAYGPWGRPDMAYYRFAELMLRGEPIEVYGAGAMARDFTYIDDIVDGVLGALDGPPPAGAHRILNVGGSCPIKLLQMIETLERALGCSANKIMRGMQPGDVRATYANTSKIHALTGYSPKVGLEEGLKRFAEWFLAFHSLQNSVPTAAQPIERPLVSEHAPA